MRDRAKLRAAYALVPIFVGALPSVALAQTPPPPDASQAPAAPSTEGTSPPATGETTPTAPPSTTNTSEPPKQPTSKWYDAVSFGAFVDAYYSQNWNGPRPNSGANLYHPYTSNSGFNLAWVGLDAGIDPDPVGATLQLRFGPAVPNLALGDFSIPGGIGFVQNGYVSWKPGGKTGRLTLNLGKFDTIFGAEVAQSHLNINYTRGYLYNLAQPFFHTGLRADLQLSDVFTLKVLAVNGWNNTIDNNRGKSFGAQLTAAPSESMTFAIGYLGGPEQADIVPTPATATAPAGTAINTGAESRWRHLADVVADFRPTSDLRFVLNGDYVADTIVDPTNNADKPVAWFGASALARYAFNEVWAAGARAEIVRDKDGQITAPNTGPITLYTGTATVEAAPHKLLLVRLDNRVDAADSDVFSVGVRSGASSTQFTSTLGVVAKTN